MSKFVRGLVWVLGVAAVLAGLLWAFLLRVWRIPEDPALAASIAPSLAGGDVVLVLTRGTPGFGELVRCPDPEDSTKFVVGRIVGVEGDLVETQGRSLLVNGKRYVGESACHEQAIAILHPTTQSEVKIECEVVQMGGGWHYRGFNPRPFALTNTRTEVGTGKVFLLSDNRDFHDDSTDFGTLPRQSCNQRILFRLWSKHGWSDERSRMSYIH
jgi:signal peptidase I